MFIYLFIMLHNNDEILKKLQKSRFELTLVGTITYFKLDEIQENNFWWSPCQSVSKVAV